MRASRLMTNSATLSARSVRTIRKPESAKNRLIPIGPVISLRRSSLGPSGTKWVTSTRPILIARSPSRATSCSWSRVGLAPVRRCNSRTRNQPRTVAAIGSATAIIRRSTPPLSPGRSAPLQTHPPPFSRWVFSCRRACAQQSFLLAAIRRISRIFLPNAAAAVAPNGATPGTSRPAPLPLRHPPPTVPRQRRACVRRRAGSAQSNAEARPSTPACPVRKRARPSQRLFLHDRPLLLSRSNRRLQVNVLDFRTIGRAMPLVRNKHKTLCGFFFGTSAAH